ncbi:MAG: PPK2 family polyphosphate kinase [Acidimicrobiales bacterium]
MSRAVVPGKRWLARPGAAVRLKDAAAHATPGAPGDKEATRAVTASMHDELIELQARLWADQGTALLVVFQAIDAGGKDGTIRHVLSGINPAGVRVTSFKRPSETEAAHDFLWRVHAACPAKGEIGVFNRSHYEDVLVTRVHGLIDEATWQRRYDQIRTFEEHLVAEGTAVVKIFLHVSKEEQRERLQDRLDSADERWKFSAADQPERALWDGYQQAFADAIAATSTEIAPWYVVPGDHKWYRDWAVTSILHGTLTGIDPQYPPAPLGIEGLVVA